MTLVLKFDKGCLSLNAEMKFQAQAVQSLQAKQLYTKTQRQS